MLNTKLFFICALVLGLFLSYGVAMPSKISPEDLARGAGCFFCDKCESTTSEDGCSTIDCGSGNYKSCYMVQKESGDDCSTGSSGNTCTTSTGFCAFNECTGC